MAVKHHELHGVAVRQRAWGELRQDILRLLIEHREPLGPKRLAALTESRRGGVQQCLSRLVEQGLADLVRRGLYAPAGRYVDGKLVE